MDVRVSMLGIKVMSRAARKVFARAGVGKFAYTQKIQESQCEGCPKHGGTKFLGKGWAPLI